MEKCSCWEEISVMRRYPNLETIQICNGTKEREECSCDGDESKCNFYPEKRKGKKTMNTAEMWLKAQEDGMCYETSGQGADTVILYYQRDKGLFAEDNMRCAPDMWDCFDELMGEQWQLRTMTKSEAETKFNIKIVSD